MTAARHIRTAFKDLLEPHLRAEGFIGKHPHFQRREGERLHLLSVVHDKWGGGFVLEFAVHPAGPLKTSWGEVIPEAELNVAHADLTDRARLVKTTRGQGTYEDFFRYDTETMDQNACNQLAAEVVDLFPQVNEWLRQRRAGVNITPFAQP